MGSELQVQSICKWGETRTSGEHVDKKMMGWPGLDQTFPSLCALHPNLCMCIWVYTFVIYHYSVGLLQLAFHR